LKTHLNPEQFARERKFISVKDIKTYVGTCVTYIKPFAIILTILRHVLVNHAANEPVEKKPMHCVRYLITALKHIISH